MRRRGRATIGLAAAALWFGGAPATAGELRVGANSSLSLGSGRVDLACADLVVGGLLSGGTGALDQVRDLTILNGIVQGEMATFTVTGDWTNSGSFDAGTSTVSLVDGCGRASATISGDSTFYDLDVTTSSGKLVSFEKTKTTTVTGHLTLAGAAGQRLQIRSTVDGSQAYLDLQGSQTVDYVEVKDNHAIGTPILYGDESTTLGNTVGWILGTQIPALGAWGLLALAVLLAAGPARALRRRGAPGPSAT